jgi:peptidoglycan/LPS O-acetylase OafA/YrhL
MFVSHEQLKACSYLPSLNGWRAVSIAIVLLAHSQRVTGFPECLSPSFRWMPNGDLGVRFFFVISGFLITWLLLREAENTGNISIKHFYARRALRILPAYCVYLLVLVCVSLVNSTLIDSNVWVGLLTYTINYIDTPWVGAHIWSLSVEEQFYILWPIIFSFAVKSPGRSIWLAWATLIPILLFPLCRTVGYLQGYSFPFNHHSFLLHGDAMAWGCITAILLHSNQLLFLMIKNHAKKSLWFSLVCLAVPHILTKLFLLGHVTVPLAVSATSLGFSILICLSVIHSERWFFVPLNLKPITVVGTMSYSIYLWQQLFCSSWTELGFTGDQTPFHISIWLLPTVAAAALSYHFIERPFLVLKSKMNISSDKRKPKTQSNVSS